ncbi:MAG: hypothetical protein DMG01_21430 [Acidobacteria bacterium]|nr:MAG: hypothetical protein DMG01_21430 [Acidobacteriota bacterium]
MRPRGAREPGRRVCRRRRRRRGARRSRRRRRTIRAPSRSTRRRGTAAGTSARRATIVARDPRPPGTPDASVAATIRRRGRG